MLKKTVLLSLSITSMVLLSGCHYGDGHATYPSDPNCSSIVHQLHQSDPVNHPQQKTAIRQAELLKEYQRYGCGTANDDTKFQLTSETSK